MMTQTDTIYEIFRCSCLRCGTESNCMPDCVTTTDNLQQVSMLTQQQHDYSQLVY